MLNGSEEEVKALREAMAQRRMEAKQEKLAKVRVRKGKGWGAQVNRAELTPNPGSCRTRVKVFF